MSGELVYGLFVMVCTLLVIFLFLKIVQLIFYWQQTGPWPVRIILAPFCLLMMIIGVLSAASLAKDVHQWWNK